MSLKNKDFMKKNILVIPGDGIGPEVTFWGKAVLEKIAEEYHHEFTFQEALMGHIAIEAFNNPLPDETLSLAKNSDAILFGAVGHPHYDTNPNLTIRPEQGLLKIRKELGLFANIRPILLFEELLFASPLKPEIIRGADILFFRELTGDVYFGKKERSSDGKTASDLMVYSKYEVDRIARKAFEAARTRRNKLCSIDKANVLESSRLWRETVQEISLEYPDVQTEHLFVDNAAMQLIKEPTRFDVILTGNLFGDILTDEASQIAGSMGMLASASLGENIGFYEPIHGSAYDIAGRKMANPIASMLSASLMLELSFHLNRESQAIQKAIKNVLKDGFRTNDIAEWNAPSEKILRTDDMGKKIIEQI